MQRVKRLLACTLCDLSRPQKWISESFTPPHSFSGVEWVYYPCTHQHILKCNAVYYGIVVFLDCFADGVPMQKCRVSKHIAKTHQATVYLWSISICHVAPQNAYGTTGRDSELDDLPGAADSYCPCCSVPSDREGQLWLVWIKASWLNECPQIKLIQIFFFFLMELVTHLISITFSRRMFPR